MEIVLIITIGVIICVAIICYTNYKCTYSKTLLRKIKIITPDTDVLERCDGMTLLHYLKRINNLIKD